jgi:hypothetical protein
MRWVPCFARSAGVNPKYVPRRVAMSRLKKRRTAGGADVEPDEVAPSAKVATGATSAASMRIISRRAWRSR